jgi:hypothetical protein
MSTEYADRKVKDILTKAKGNAKLTEQAILTLIERDQKFLLSLTEPYLSGIIAHAIERGRKQANIKLTQPAPLKPSPLLTKTPKGKVAVKPLAESSLDKALKVWAEGFDKTEIKDRPKTNSKVSQKHMDAMNALVSKKTKN